MPKWNGIEAYQDARLISVPVGFRHVATIGALSE